MKISLLLVFVASVCAFGGEKTNDARTSDVILKHAILGKAATMVPRASVSHDAAVTYDGNSMRQVVVAGYTIQPGDNYDSGDIPINFAGAENVAIALNSPTDDLNPAIIAVYWAAPKEYYTLTDALFGDMMFSGLGGASKVPVYGPILRLVIFNTGKVPLVIRQLTVYTCVSLL